MVISSVFLVSERFGIHTIKKLSAMNTIWMTGGSSIKVLKSNQTRLFCSFSTVALLPRFSSKSRSTILLVMTSSSKIRTEVSIHFSNLLLLRVNRLPIFLTTGKSWRSFRAKRENNKFLKTLKNSRRRWRIGEWWKSKP
mgnify:CR=1 FL=1